MAKSASDPDYFLEIAEYVNAFFSDRHWKKIYSKVLQKKKEDSKEYFLANTQANQSVEAMKSELWKVIDADPALSSDLELIGLRKRWDGLAAGNIMPMDKTEAYLFVVEDTIVRLDHLKASYRLELSQELRTSFRAYGEAKKQFQYKQRVSVWNSFEALFRVAYFISSNLEEFRDKPINKLGAIMTKGSFAQHIDRTKPIQPEERNEYDRHVGRVTLFVEQSVETKKIGSSVWELVEKASVVIGLAITLSPIVTQWLQGPPFPYYRETATSAAILLGIYLIIKFRTRIIVFLERGFQRVKRLRPTQRNRPNQSPKCSWDSSFDGGGDLRL